MANLQWGQYLRVLYTPPSGPPGLEIVRYDSTAATPKMHVGVSFTRHIRPAAQSSSVIVWNLSAVTREALGLSARLAREQAYSVRGPIQAGRIMVFAGRSVLDADLVVNDAILDIRSTYSAPNWRTEITAQDGRLPWEGFFLNTSEVRPPVAAAVAARAGITSPPVPDTRKRKSVTYSAIGPGKDEALAVFSALGLAPIFNGDAVRFVPTNGTLLLPALVIDGIVQDPGQPGAWGARQMTTLYDPGLKAGRQVVYKGALSRLEEVAGELSTFGGDWNARISARPV